MTYSDVLAHFGTQVGIAAALGIGQPSVSAWRKVVPARYQYELEVITGGALLVDPPLRLPHYVRERLDAARAAA